MENSSQKIIATLNDLVKINHDRSEGYKVAAGETRDAELKTLFDKYSLQSDAFSRELGNEVMTFGDQPATGTRNDGKLFRIWMDIKASISGNDRKAILNSCEAGEDVAIKTYEDALMADVMLPVNVRQLISRQKRELQYAHNAIKSMRDEARSSERYIF